MKSSYSQLIGILLMAGTSWLQAQSGLIQSSEIIKDAPTDLGETNRSYEKITEFPPAQPDPIISYQPGEVVLSLPRMDSKTKVVPIKSETLKPAGLGYLRGGAGNYAATYLEFFLSARKTSKLTYFVHTKHKAFGNGPVKYARMSENLIEGGSTYWIKKTQFGLKADYTRYRYNFYGFDNSISDLDEDSLKLLFNKFHVGLEVKNRLEKEKIQYRSGVDYFYTGNSDWFESEIFVPLNFSYGLDSASRVGLESSFSFMSQKDSLSRSRQLIALTPYYERSAEKYKIKGGLSFQYTNDTLNDVKGLHLYPSVYGEYYLLPQTATVFVEFGGGIVKNNLRNTLSTTPYLERNIHLANSNRKMEMSIGLRNRIKSNVHLSIKGVYGIESNFMVLTNGLDSSSFSAIYDPGKVTYSGFDLGLQAQISKSFTSSFQTIWRSYQTDTLEYAWHRPGVNVQWRNKFNLRQKLYFTADFYYLSNLRGYNLSTGSSVKLKDIADLNLGVEYRFSNSFSAFISANNVFGQKYQRFLYYPSNGFNLLGGLSYNF
jgi:hypothetical protein